MFILSCFCPVCSDCFAFSTMESPQSMLGDLPADSDEPGPSPVAIDQKPNPSGKGSYFAMPNLRRANTVAQEGNTRISKSARDRSATSLLRAKGSLGMLQQTPLKRSRTHHPVPGPREPKHFTVGNVGQNGKIFLRYGLLFLAPCAIRSAVCKPR